MNKQSPIVLTNDDGIDAEGLRALAAAVEALSGAAVCIVAPSRGYSGCSQLVTMHEPIHVTQRRDREFAVDGSPADCVRLALTNFAPDCRLVLSGINHGGNLGHDIHLSGTVGAAREAALLGVNAVAISHYLRPGIPHDWPRAAEWAVSVLKSLPLDTGAGGHLWNVNLPHAGETARDMPRVEYCRPCRRSLPIAYTLKDGAYHYEAGHYHTRIQDDGTDVSACFGGAITISELPVTLAEP